MPYKEAFERWRCYLFGVPFRARERGEELAKEKENAGTAQFFRERVSREKSLEILSEGGRLKRSDYLRCRVRYFTDGATLGSKTFIEDVFESSRSLFSEKRETGARSLQGLELEAKPKRLYNLRHLQKEVIS